MTPRADLILKIVLAMAAIVLVLEALEYMGAF